MKVERQSHSQQILQLLPLPLY